MVLLFPESILCPLSPIRRSMFGCIWMWICANKQLFAGLLSFCFSHRSAQIYANEFCLKWLKYECAWYVFLCCILRQLKLKANITISNRSVTVLWVQVHCLCRFNGQNINFLAIQIAGAFRKMIKIPTWMTAFKELHLWWYLTETSVTVCFQQKSITMILVHSYLGKIWARYSRPSTNIISYTFM